MAFPGALPRAFMIRAVGASLSTPATRERRRPRRPVAQLRSNSALHIDLSVDPGGITDSQPVVERGSSDTTGSHTESEVHRHAACGSGGFGGFQAGDGQLIRAVIAHGHGVFPSRIDLGLEALPFDTDGVEHLA